MMWQREKTDTTGNSEPEELRSLKSKLASLECKCLKCNKFHADKNKRKLLVKENEKGVQVETEAKPPDVEVTHNQTLTEDGYLPESSIYRKDLLCPSCYLTLSILKGGVIKILKDEELETNFSYFSRDKATEHAVPVLEKKTSLTCKPVLKYTNPSYYDTISELTSMESLASSRNRSRREVTFTLHNNYYSDEELPTSPAEQQLPPSPEPAMETVVLDTDPLPFGNCVSIDTYIDSIRPPWTEILE